MISLSGTDSQGAVPMYGAWSVWFDRGTAGCSLADARLHKRLRTLLERMGGAMGEKHSAGLPGPGEHQGGLPLRRQRTDQRGRGPRRASVTVSTRRKGRS